MTALPRTRGLRRLSTIAAVFACLAGAAPSAQAGQYDLISCSMHSPWDFTGTTAMGWSSDGYWWGENSCSHPGLRFAPRPSGPEGSAGYWRFSLSGHQFSHYRFRLQGGDAAADFEYSIAACTGCAPVRTIGTRLFNIYPDLIEGDLPPTNEFVFKASCIAPSGCDTKPGVNMFDFTFSINDDEAPYAQFYGFNTRSSLSIDGVWNAPSDIHLSVSASEGGYGISGAEVTTPGQDGRVTIWQGNGGKSCLGPATLTNQNPCGSPAWLNGPGDFSQVPDGRHDLKLAARDYFGHEAEPVTLQNVGIDSVPPREPRNLAVTGLSPSGWTPLSAQSLTWKNFGETVETQTESGVAAAWIDVDPVAVPAGTANPAAVRIAGANRQTAPFTLPAEGSWNVDVWTEDNAGQLSSRSWFEVGRDSDIPPAPVLNPNPWVSRTSLINGYEQTWTNPPASLVESGICNHLFVVDALSGTIPAPGGTLAGPAARASIPPATPDGVNYVHVRSVSCSGRPSAAAHEQIRVDGALPAASLLGVPAGWSNSPLSLSVLADDGAGSGVQHALLGIDSGPLVSLPPMTPVAVGEGRHTIRFGAVDKTGNNSPVGVVAANVDMTPPLVSFEPEDVEDPARVTAQVSDPLSGIAQARLEYRRIDPGAPAGETWHALTENVRPEAGSTQHLTLSRKLPDASLPDGLYESRVVAFDEAGNRAESGATKPDGAQKLTSLPARDRLVLTSGVTGYRTVWSSGRGSWSSKALCLKRSKSCKPRRVINSAAVAAVGVSNFVERRVVIGHLLRVSGDPVANAALMVTMKGRGVASVPRTLSVTTDEDGFYSLPVPRSSSTEFQVVYPESATTRQAASTTTQYFRAGAELRVSKRRVHIGERFALSLRLRSGGGDVPARGKLILWEYWNGSKWSSTFESEYTTTRGTLRSPQRLERAIEKPYYLTLRAKVPTEGTWPFQDGFSNSVRIKILP